MRNISPSNAWLYLYLLFSNIYTKDVNLLLRSARNPSDRIKHVPNTCDGRTQKLLWLITICKRVIVRSDFTAILDSPKMTKKVTFEDSTLETDTKEIHKFYLQNLQNLQKYAKLYSYIRRIKGRGEPWGIEAKEKRRRQERYLVPSIDNFTLSILYPTFAFLLKLLRLQP